jgi:taurine transport system permease protein
MWLTQFKCQIDHELDFRLALHMFADAYPTLYANDSPAALLPWPLLLNPSLCVRLVWHAYAQLRALVYAEFAHVRGAHPTLKPLAAQHFMASMLRVFAAFLLGCLTAIPVGIAMGMSRFWRGIFDPPIELLRPLPPLAYLPLIIIWFGIDEFPKVLLIYLSCFAPLAMAARSGMRSASQEQMNAAYSMGASYSQVIRHVVLPAAMPEILVGMRISIGFGWSTLVAAEMVAANVGLGQMVLNASNFLRTDIVVMGIIVIGSVAFAFDLLMRWVEKKVVPWRGRM